MELDSRNICTIRQISFQQPAQKFRFVQEIVRACDEYQTAPSSCKTSIYFRELWWSQEASPYGSSGVRAGSMGCGHMHGGLRLDYKNKGPRAFGWNPRNRSEFWMSYMGNLHLPGTTTLSKLRKNEKIKIKNQSRSKSKAIIKNKSKNKSKFNNKKRYQIKNRNRIKTKNQNWNQGRCRFPAMLIDHRSSDRFDPRRVIRAEEASQSPPRRRGIGAEPSRRSRFGSAARHDRAYFVQKQRKVSLCCGKILPLEKCNTYCMQPEDIDQRGATWLN
ncbi:unnamed protein product, partial [Nesidiocoris tenuis]